MSKSQTACPNQIHIKLLELGKRTATEVVEEQAQAITDLLYAANRVTQEVCTATSAGTNTGQHYINRPTSKKRQKLTKQLNTITCLKSHLNSVTSSAVSVEELEEQYPETISSTVLRMT